MRGGSAVRFFFFLKAPPPPELSPLPLHPPLPTPRGAGGLPAKGEAPPRGAAPPPRGEPPRRYARPPGRVLADLSRACESARSRSQGDRRAVCEEARGGARVTARGDLSGGVGRGAAHGDAGGGGGPHEEPRLRRGDEARADAGRGASTLSR